MFHVEREISQSPDSLSIKNIAKTQRSEAVRGLPMARCITCNNQLIYI
jgi:hypothetical protein